MKTNKQSGRKGGVALSSKAIKRPTRSKQVLSDKESPGRPGGILGGAASLDIRPLLSRYFQLWADSDFGSRHDVECEQCHILFWPAPRVGVRGSQGRGRSAVRRDHRVRLGAHDATPGQGRFCVLYWHAFGDADEKCFLCNIDNDSAWAGVADFLAERTDDWIHAGY